MMAPRSVNGFPIRLHSENRHVWSSRIVSIYRLFRKFSGCFGNDYIVAVCKWCFSGTDPQLFPEVLKYLCPTTGISPSIQIPIPDFGNNLQCDEYRAWLGQNAFNIAGKGCEVVVSICTRITG